MTENNYQQNVWQALLVFNPYLSISENRQLLMDIIKWITDINKSGLIIEINKWITDIDKWITDIDNSIIDIDK